MQLCSGELKRGEKHYIYTTNLRNYILLKAVPADPIPGWDSKLLALIYSKDRKDALTTQVVIVDKDNRELKLLFDYSESVGIAFREVAIYCQFWMINRTYRSILIKDTHGNEAAGQYPKLRYPSTDVKQNDTRLQETSSTEEEPLMFSFREGQKKIKLYVEKSQPTDSFSLDNVGVSGDLSCTDDSYRYTIGFYNGLGPSKFRRTKVITFTPRYIIFNRTNYR